MNTNKNYFWISYTDLMTSLFFVMLVLYVLSFATIRAKQKATEDQLKKIKELQNAVKSLPKTYFTYDSTNKRFLLNRQIQFRTGSSNISDPDDETYLMKVGREIEKLIKSLQTNFPTQNIQYLVLIEGQASKDNYAYNDQLSYERALALHRFWQNRGIDFGQYQNKNNQPVCDVQVAGSGTGGIGRLSPERLNQRFLIQIIPKAGEVK